MRFYNDCKQFNGVEVVIEFNKLKWIDANMVAVLNGLLAKLKNENNLSFTAEVYHGQFDILFTNGFFRADNILHNDTGTCVHLREFKVGEGDEFVHYIENDLINHHGVNIDEESKEIIINSLIEIYANYCTHSNTEYPIFVCGQYYPKKNILKFTIYDLGVGFFPSINRKVPSITSDDKAISWALVSGNSTKIDAPGGLGLSDLKDKLLNNNGHLEIVSGQAYKKCTIKDGKELDSCKILGCDNIGTTINLFFNGF